ncbi:MAG: SBBP repeat-containing protein [Nitrospirae bacterium]|nr:SBBP repeat-containing protein [Nitrospirota bacterium]
MRGHRHNMLFVFIGVGLLMGLQPAYASTVNRARVDRIRATNSPARTPARGSYGVLPLSFIRNDGQVNPAARYFEKGNGHATFFTPDGVVFALRSGQGSDSGGMSLKLAPVGGNPHSTITAEGAQPTEFNYFIGSDAARWKTNVPAYDGVRYQEIYPGIDMKFYGTARQLEYDIVVKPGADPSAVRLAYEGGASLTLTPAGDLEITHQGGTIIQKKPVIYQVIDGKRVDVAGTFKVLTPSAFGFEVASYDRRHPLVIDPALVYSTFLGGTADDIGRSIAVDAAGNAYVVGVTYSPDFPVTAGAADTSYNGGFRDVFVAKLNPDGTGLLYATYLGGSGSVGIDGDDFGDAIAVDAAGNAVITGMTNSLDFPVTAGAYDTSQNGDFDAFVVKLDPSGGLSYATYLGGDQYDGGMAVAIDGSGNAYVAGQTLSGTVTPSPGDFPTTAGAYDRSYDPSFGACDAFVAKFNPTGGLVYSTYLGGGGDDLGSGITVDGAGNAYIVGNTSSTNFPVTAGAYHTSYNGGVNDVFVAKLNAAGSSLLLGTYLGGSGGEQNDARTSVRLDAAGNIYVAGSTTSTNFPVTPGAFQQSWGAGPAGQQHVFVTKFNPAGSALLYSTYLAGSHPDASYALAVDAAGNAYVTGYTGSSDFPTTAGAYDPTYNDNGGFDTFVVKLNPAGSSLLYGSFLGGSEWDSGNGIAIDATGHAYVAGITSSSGFPVTPGAFSGTKQTGGQFGMDAFVAKLETAPDLVIWDVSTAATSLQRGTSFTVTDTALNQGVSAAAATTNGFSLSANGTTDNYVFPVTRSVPALGAGANNTGSTLLTVPSTVAFGAYYVCARADSTNAVVEGDESNNRRCSATTIAVISPPPVVTGVTPAQVVYGATASQSVTITGSNFVNGSTITVGSLSGTTMAGSVATASMPYVYVNATQVKFWWPNTALAPGAYAVQVTHPAAAGGSSATLANGFTVIIPQPAITSVAAASVIDGISTSQSVTITGSNFVNGSTITVGSLTGTTVTGSTATATLKYVYVNATQVKFWWPNTALAPGAYAVQVTNPAAAGGLSATLANGFTVTAPQPAVGSITPASVTYGITANSSITITGTNFINGATITVGGLSGTTVAGSSATAGVPYVYVNATQLKFWWPNTALQPETYNVAVTNPASYGGLTGTKVGGFTVVTPLPTITTVAASSVTYGITANSSITLSGSNFAPGATITVGSLSGATVITASLAATATNPYEYNSATDIRFWWPNTALPPGTYDVVVTNPPSYGGLSGTKVGGFTVVTPLPMIAAVAASSVTYGITASSSITLSGTNFAPGATITVGSLSGATVSTTASLATASNPYEYNSAMSMAFWWPNTALPPGTYDVVVANPASYGGLSGTKVGGFVVVVPTPAITTVAAASVTYGLTASTSVAIGGTNFAPGATITVGSLSGTTISTTSSLATASNPYEYNSATSIAFWWPNTALPPGTYDVVVTNPASYGGLTGTKVGGFTVVAPLPTITSVTPSTVTSGVTASSSVAIAGTNFAPGATITVSTLSGATVSTAATAATATTPYEYNSATSMAFWWPNTSLPPGTYDVIVTNPAAGGGLSATKVGGFVVQ